MAGKPTTGSPATKAPAGSRTVTFVNDVQQTIWVAGWQQTAQPALATYIAEEASPGPRDSHYLFQRFADLMRAHKRG